MNIGDSNNGATINFDGAGFQAVQSIATADIVQNTWREITKLGGRAPSASARR